MQIPYKCENKTSFVFSQVILKVDGKLDAKDKIMPFKNIKPQNFFWCFFFLRNGLLKSFFDMR